jgi:hypothetical protein
VVRYQTGPATKNPVRLNNVTVRVISISDFFPQGEDLTITCSDTQGDIAFSSVPRAAVLLIENHSDHIVSLGQTAHLTGTVIVLEDEFGNAFRLFSEESWKKDLKARITAFYDATFLAAGKDYRTKQEPRIADYAESLAGSYSSEYKRYVRNFRLNSVLQLLNPFWWSGVVLFALAGPQADASAVLVPPLDVGRSPNSIANHAKDEFEKGIQRELDLTSARVNQVRDDCLAKADLISPTNFVPMIMSGTYPLISILPHRELRIYVPFEEVAEYPSKLHLRIFDLVTDQDAAGMPTRRTNFSFELRKVDAGDAKPDDVHL